MVVIPVQCVNGNGAISVSVFGKDGTETVAELPRLAFVEQQRMFQEITKMCRIDFRNSAKGGGLILKTLRRIMQRIGESRQSGQDVLDANTHNPTSFPALAIHDLAQEKIVVVLDFQ